MPLQDSDPWLQPTFYTMPFSTYTVPNIVKNSFARAETDSCVVHKKVGVRLTPIFH